MSAPPNRCFFCRPDLGGVIMFALQLEMAGQIVEEYMCDAHGTQLLDSPLWLWAQLPAAALPKGVVRRVG